MLTEPQSKLVKTYYLVFYFLAMIFCYGSATFYLIKIERINLKYLAAFLNSECKLKFWVTLQRDSPQTNGKLKFELRT